MKSKTRSNKPSSQVISNRRASFDYELGEPLTVGLELTGREVRAARTGKVQLKGSFVSVRDNQLWLNNASFSIILNQRGETDRTVDTTARRILARRKQIDQLIDGKKQGTTIVPLRLLTQGKYIKLVISPGKGKKSYDKRQSIKKRDTDRSIKKISSNRYM
ncbi:MAG: SsrA-binding protein SmpB [bacterium]|nr:SsrA-binding protein SmpB [bacterium]